MSAIWGYVDLGGGTAAGDLAQRMRKPFDAYRIDRFACRTEKNVMMGCGIQYIQPEAEREELPVADSEAGTVFTADCFIDNRGELIDALCPGNTDIPDGSLLYKAYLRWRGDTPKHVYGSYAFAAYDTKANILMLSADHTFSRSIYYAREGNRVYFSTLIQPILSVRGERPPPNGRWICGYLGQPHLGILTEAAETAFGGVYKVEPYHYMLFSERGGESVQFWFPQAIPPLKLKGDGEYKTRFITVMETAAAQVTRTNRETGILLSSGMDSSAAAAFTAPELAKRGKKLLSYTSVPLSGFVSERHWSSVIDETDGVRALCGMYPNIAPVFDAQPELDALSDLRRHIETFEQPYKAFSNTPWITGFSERAALDGAAVLLTGQCGNAALSFGDIQTYVKTNFYRFRWLRILKFFRRFARRTGVRKWIRALFSCLPYLIPDGLRLLLKRDYLKGSIVRRDTAAEFGIKRGSPALEWSALTRRAYTFGAYRTSLVNQTMLSHIGEAETKNGLKYGVLYRDISKDVRLLEFCLGAPMECFVNDNGVTRRLIREYMRGRLPETMLRDEFRRGVQAADWLARLERKWGVLFDGISRACRSEKVLQYADAELVESALARYRSAPPSENDTEFLNLLFVYTLSVFLETSGGRWGTDGTRTGPIALP